MTLQVGAPPRSSPEFVLAPGVTPPTQPGGRPDFLDDVIVAMAFADRETVAEAVEQGRLSGKTAASILLDKGEINEEQLARATAERNGLPFVDLDRFEIDPDAKRLIGSDAARRYRAVPISFDADGALIVALADPTDVLAVSDIGEISKSEVRAAVAVDSTIGAMIEQMPKHVRAPAARFEPDQIHSVDAATEPQADLELEQAASPPADLKLDPAAADQDPELDVAEPEPVAEAHEGPGDEDRVEADVGLPQPQSAIDAVLTALNGDRPESKTESEPAEPEATQPPPKEDSVLEINTKDLFDLEPLRVDPAAFGPPPPEPDEPEAPVEEPPVAEAEPAEPEAFLPELRVEPLRIEVEPEPPVALEPEPMVEPEPPVALEPEPEPEPAPAPVVAPEPEPVRRQTSGALHDRIMDLIEAAVDDVAASEVERVESELSGERELRIELERRLEEEGATREEMASAIAEANREIDAVSARLEKYERKSHQFKDERDQARAERDKLRETIAESDVAVERERERRLQTEERLRGRLSGASESREGLERSLDQLEAAISGARDAAKGLAAVQSEVGGELDSAG